MKPSQLLKKFLSTGNKPANQREVSALLDESRSLLVSKLPSTAVHIQNLTQGDIDDIVAGGRDGMIDRAVAIHRAQNLSAPRPSRPAAKARPTAKPSAAPAPAPPAATAKALPARPAPKPINSMTNNPPSTTPHLDQFERLEGTAASHFYATHGAAIRAESGTRQHEKKNLEKEMNAARATARQRSDLKKITR